MFSIFDANNLFMDITGLAYVRVHTAYHVYRYILKPFLENSRFHFFSFPIDISNSKKRLESKSFRMN